MTDEPHNTSARPDPALLNARHPSSDEEWVAEFQKGSAQGFSILFDRYRQPVFGFFCRRIADRAAAEELAQETFLALLRALPRYRQETLFRVYLYAIAFKILNRYRRKMAFRAAFLGMPDEQPEPGVSPGMEASLAVRQAVRQLDATDREILLLRHFDLLSYAEIAKVLDLPINTVRSRLFRARAALRALLETPPRAAMTHAPLRSQEQA
ncbi:MAG TPA: sigma-70 family RNA polymerase sigma factor [Terracidiphilus sp.]|nr:sigma-70 family RNA polymerase sigma factor [Terracidiphilus sp.]